MTSAMACLPQGEGPFLERAADSRREPSVVMVAPLGARCGVADYTRHLVEALEGHARIAAVVDAAGFGPEHNRCDLVHIQHQYFLFGGVAPWKCRIGRLLRRIERPIVMTAHEFVEPTGGPLRGGAIALTNRLHFGSPAVRSILVHTEWDRARLARFGPNGDRACVVRHGVPTAPALPARDEARRALGLEDRFVVTVFGFLSRRKGHAVAVEALRQMPPDAVLLLAGGRHPDDRTGYVADLEARIDAAGVRERCRVTGYLDEDAVRTVMSATDIVLAPFAESSGSGSLAMAFACRKPILASDIAPHAEIVGDTPGALRLAPVADGAAMAAAAAALRDDSAARERLARGAAAYAERHSYDRVAAETAAVYRAVRKQGKRCGSG